MNLPNHRKIEVQGFYYKILMKENSTLTRRRINVCWPRQQRQLFKEKWKYRRRHFHKTLKQFPFHRKFIHCRSCSELLTKLLWRQYWVFKQVHELSSFLKIVEEFSFNCHQIICSYSYLYCKNINIYKQVSSVLQRIS